MAPALRRSVLGRPLSWRNPWTLLLGVLAAFQAGVIVTLLWTSGRTSLGPLELTPPPAAGPLATGPVVAPPPAGGAALPPPAVTPPVAPPAVTPPAVTPPVAPPPPATDRTHGRGRKPPVTPANGTPDGTPPAPRDAGVDAPDALVEVEITSEPEGATVRIAGAVWGVTPLTAYLPASKPVTIYVELDDYRPARLGWSPTGRRALHAVLQPQESP